MSIRFGISPIAWINDDMPELGGDTPVERVLADARDLGFAGVELGGKFPKDPAKLKALLDGYDLELVGGWYSASLLTRSAEDEIDAMRGHLALLEALGSKVFVVAETSNAIHGRRDTPLRNSPRLGDDDWARFGERLTQVADFIDRSEMRLAYHHHLGTVVETPEELDRFLAVTGPGVGLTLDTGHAALGGIDPLRVIRAAPERIAHVHCKDVRRDVFDAIIASNASFLDGVLEGMFTVPGDGDLDFTAIMEALSAIGYAGWIVVEAEQDPAIADPRAYAKLGLGVLRGQALLSGLEIAA
ncbi:MAG TPA: myo-inosose-2 dehydratase [Sphingomicrobium sp.]|nr:myo-inosose-2 dehydratase [Sphingomicrobium sp.]